MSKRRNKNSGSKRKQKLAPRDSHDGSKFSAKQVGLLFCSVLLAVAAFLYFGDSSEAPEQEVASKTRVGERPAGRNEFSGAGSGSRRSSTAEGSGSAHAEQVVLAKTDVVPSTPLGRIHEQEAYKGLDPSTVGWQTEAFNDVASSQLKKIASSIERGGDIEDAIISKLITSNFRCSSLRPTRTEEVFRDTNLSVQRAAAIDAGSNDLTLVGAEGLRKAIGSLPQSAGGEGFHAKFKIVGVELGDSTANLQVYAEGGGMAVQGMVQWRARWDCSWVADSEGQPRLSAISVREYEQVESLQGDQPWLVDCSESVLGGDESYRAQLSHGMEYWLRRLEGRLHVSRLGHNGIALGDVNGDGREDIYVCQSGGLPNRLFIAREDGTAYDAAGEAGVDFLDDSTCSLIVDLNNDGHQDLVLMTISAGVVMSGDGTGKFTLRTLLPECRNAFSLTAADYDNDGQLDLFVGRYWPTAENRGDIPIPVPYYDAKNGGRNLLFRSQGDWKFKDVTVETGLDVDNTRYTMAAAWNDINQDGLIDLYLANDFGRNCLYLNEGGRFRNVAEEYGVEDAASGMSVTFADYDHDGNDDIYISNMFSSAGNRVTYQRQYETHFDASGLKAMQRMARGNTLFRNSGDGRFQDVSVVADVTMGRWSWGSLFADLNNDSWDDLLVLNGNITNEDSGDL